LLAQLRKGLDGYLGIKHDFKDILYGVACCLFWLQRFDAPPYRCEGFGRILLETAPWMENCLILKEW
jgi:hypothetical protein